MTTTPSQTPSSPSQQGSVGDESFARLHRMSTTAGLGSTDYVAVNTPSVAALLLGMASWLATLDSILLVIPLVGVLVSVFALIQIFRSNGTQTGYIPAIGGILLSLGFSAYVGAQVISERQTEAEDRQAVVGLIEELKKDLNTQAWDAAYAKFTPTFQQRIDKQAFSKFWSDVTASPYAGPLAKIEWNQRLVLQNASSTSNIVVARLVWGFVFEKSTEPVTREVILIKNGNTWQVQDIDSFFPPPPEQRDD